MLIFNAAAFIGVDFFTLKSLHEALASGVVLVLALLRGDHAQTCPQPGWICEPLGTTSLWRDPSFRPLSYTTIQTEIKSLLLFIVSIVDNAVYAGTQLSLTNTCSRGDIR